MNKMEKGLHSEQITPLRLPFLYERHQWQMVLS